MALLAHYKLNGDPTDASGNGNHATATSITYGAGKLGNAAYFDEVNSFITLPMTYGSPLSFSFMGWFYCDGSANNAQRHLFDCGSGRTCLSWQRAALTVNLGLHDGGSWQSFGPTPALNEWHHVAFTLDAATSKANCYVDGVQSGSELNYTPRALNTTIFLGRYFSYITSEFAGYMDDVRFYLGVANLRTIQLVYADGDGTETAWPKWPVKTIVQDGKANILGVIAK